MKLFLLIYHLIGYVVAPFVAVILWLKGKKQAAYRKRWSERFGFYQSHQPVDIWFHAVSVGEVVASSSMVLACLDKGLHVLVTTMTPTGSDQVKRLWGERVFHQYCPFDFPFALKRFLNDRQPKMLVILETELWPGMILSCQQRHIPIMLANARISNRSYPRYLKMVWFWKWLMTGLNKIYVQSEQDKERFLSIGARESQLELAGNLKFQVPDMSVTQCEFWKNFKINHANRLIWVVGSTHAGEEEQILQVWSILRLTYTCLLLVIVPRHPERFDAVYQLLKQSNSGEVRRLSNGALEDNLDILLVDRMGWLSSLYSIADVAFVGGSLAPIGGHNLLEPLVFGVPVCTGPHTHNQHDLVRLLTQEGVLDVVEDTHELLKYMQEVLQEPEKQIGLEKKRLDVFKRYQGSLEKHMLGIEANLVV